MLFLLAFVVTFLCTPSFIKMLSHWQMNQLVREEGPQSHLSKKGTPTMGGLLFILVTCFAITLYILLKQSDPSLFWGFYMFIAYSIVGFLDDYLKKIKKSPYGLKAREDISLQILLAIPFLLYLFFTRNPGLSGWVWFPFKLLVILSITNSVNLTDGLDGLLSGLILILFLFFFCIHFQFGLFNPYLMYIIGGSLAAFLYYNFFPAKLFMGNIGSFALGGFVAFLVLWTEIDWLFLILGGIFLIEACSVILQVSFFKYTKRKTGSGKRIFKMSPIHHHFELAGFHETTITVRFWLLQCLLTLLSLFLYTYWKGI